MPAWLGRLRAISIAGPFAVALLATLLFAWSNRHALQMPGFAEDMGLVQSLSAAAKKGELLEEISPRLLGPLWGSGSTMWRPWAFASLALDAYLYGSATGLWHITNLSLHIAAAIFTALLSGRWLRSTWAGVTAYSMMLLHPWSAEITMWLVGRFDGWTTAAIAATLYFSWRNRGFDRWLCFAAASTGIAYLSKESALILLPATGMLLLGKNLALSASERHPPRSSGAAKVGRAFYDCLKQAWPMLMLQLLLLSAYLVSRWLAVGTVSTNVYSSTQVLSGSELLVRVLAHLRAFFSIAAEAPLAASIAIVLIVAAFAMSLVARCKSLLWFTAVWLAIVFIGAAMHFRAMVGDGDGYRLYYLAVLGVALCVAAGVASGRQRAPRLTLMLLLAGCIGLATWQNAVNQQWWVAAKEIKATTQGVGTELPRLENSDYAIVLLEDPIGHVPAFRNSQGAVIRAATPRRPGDDNVDFMVAFLPSQLNEWHRLMQEDVVGMITKRADAPLRPTRFYCKERGEVTLRHLGVWPADTIGEWRQKWVAATKKNCPTLKL